MNKMKNDVASPIVYEVKYNPETANNLNKQIKDAFSNDDKARRLLIDYSTVCD